MRTRVLSANEWGRLEQAAGMPPLRPYLKPEETQAIVLERGDKILATLVLAKVPHLEGFWVHPDHRGGKAWIQSWDEVKALGRSLGYSWAIAGAHDDRMRVLLWKLGAAKIAMDSFAISLGE